MSGINALAFSADGKFLASGSADYSVLVWDATWKDIALLKRRADPFPAKVEKLWQDLSNPDAAVAHRAVWNMVSTPNMAVPFLCEQLRPVQPADPMKLAHLITDLDRNDFDIRENATRVLEKQADLAEGALRKALLGEPSEEAKRRITLLLNRIDSGIPIQENLRIMRATAVLELTGTIEARTLLKELSKGAPDARLTKEADLALQRLNRRLNDMP